MAKGDDLEERLIEFAVRIVKLCEAMPKTTAGRHLGNQLVRKRQIRAYKGKAARTERQVRYQLTVSCNQTAITEAELKVGWRI